MSFHDEITSQLDQMQGRADQEIQGAEQRGQYQQLLQKTQALSSRAAKKPDDSVTKLIKDTVSNSWGVMETTGYSYPSPRARMQVPTSTPSRAGTSTSATRWPTRNGRCRRRKTKTRTASPKS